jgi:peptide/nickel transport system ATP-binding protein
MSTILEAAGLTCHFDLTGSTLARLLLEAVPDVAAPNRHRIIAAGEVPNPVTPPPGCPFHPRCGRADAACRTVVPPLRDGVACRHPLQA